MMSDIANFLDLEIHIKSFEFSLEEGNIYENNNFILNEQLMVATYSTLDSNIWKYDFINF